MQEYVLQKTDRACGFNVSLLIEKEPSDVDQPAFYICFGCKTVAQIGVGLVSEEV